jgi:hypothetical protein
LPMVRFARFLPVQAGVQDPVNSAVQSHAASVSVFNLRSIDGAGFDLSI